MFTGITGKNNRNDRSHEIKDKVIDGLEYLHRRAEFWRQQKPMYARHRDRERKAKARQSHKPPKDAMAKVVKNLEDVDDGKCILNNYTVGLTLSLI